jgi:ribosomal protein S18 acetylase RimI-like enzyme
MAASPVSPRAPPPPGIRSGDVSSDSTPLPDIRLRTATPADYDAIAAVTEDWWGRPVRSALPRLFLDHFHATSTVAEAGGELAGFLVGFLSPSLPDAAYIHFVGVHPGWRGRGLARVLYERFFALAAADGRTVVGAVTAPVNAASIAFHTALGFTVSDPLPGYDGPGDVKVHFERRLA